MKPWAPYIAAAIAITAWLTAGTVLVVTGHPWWAALCFVAAGCVGVERVKE